MSVPTSRPTFGSGFQRIGEPLAANRAPTRSNPHFALSLANQLTEHRHRAQPRSSADGLALHRHPIRLPGLLAAMLARSSNLQPKGNVAPTQQAPVARRNSTTRERQIDLLQWGLIPGWTKNAEAARKPINARAATVATTGMFNAASPLDAALYRSTCSMTGMQRSTASSLMHSPALIASRPFSADYGRAGAVLMAMWYGPSQSSPQRPTPKWSAYTNSH